MNDKLLKIQSELKSPKSQHNSFGNYNYRSCEDILEAVKPLLKEHELTLLLSDEVVSVGIHNYVKASASLHDASDKVQVFAYAREAETKKGMDDAQITGSASSYARKYALNGLFAIDDTKDADTQDNSQIGSGIAQDTRNSYPDGPPKTDKAKTFLASLKTQINSGFNFVQYDTQEKKNFIADLIGKETIDTIEEAKSVLNEVQALGSDDGTMPYEEESANNAWKA